MNNGAAQTAQAQQSNQLQAEQFLAQQQQKAEQQWAQFFQNNPSPASTWSGIAAPNFGGMPSHIGGGSFGPGGGLQGSFGGWSPTGPHGTPMFAAPPSQVAMDKSGGGGSGGKKPPPSTKGGGGNNNPPGWGTGHERT